jgi:hypothetical protein
MVRTPSSRSALQAWVPDHQDAVGTPEGLAHRDRRLGPATNQVQELIEDQLVVLWTWTAFRMELHRSHRQVFVHQALDRAVMKVAMTDSEATARRHALNIDLEFVILRRHAHPAGPQIKHRMVAAVVAERQS